MTKEELFWLYINNTDNMTAPNFYNLYFNYKSIDQLKKAIVSGDVSFELKHKEEILSDSWFERAIGITEYMFSKNIKVIFYRSYQYPAQLKNIDCPPPIIYYIGDLSIIDRDSVAIVGSRVSSAYGRKCARNFSNELAKQDICVISGMAEGIDSCAHNGALEVGGLTCAVLGGGVDFIYPPSNFDLYREICKNGLVISEYPLGSKPQRGHFPERNRIIIGLAQCLVVAEAGLPSGTMSTVDYALDQGKNIYAIPGSIHSPTSAGTNYLIKCGSLCAIDPMDVLAEFGRFRVNKEEAVIPENDAFEELHKNILKLLTIEDLTFEELEEALNVDALQLNTALMLLEINGYVVKNDGRSYSYKK